MTTYVVNARVTNDKVLTNTFDTLLSACKWADKVEGVKVIEIEERKRNDHGLLMEKVVRYFYR